MPYNPLQHWNGNIGTLRANPYQAFGAARNATKASPSKDPNNPRKQSYEEKMDKQRLEHILFSGDQSTPLTQQKERMRQKLAKKNSKKLAKGKLKKTQSLPNGATSSHGLLSLDSAKRQKNNGDNGGYFLTDIAGAAKSASQRTPNKGNAGKKSKVKQSRNRHSRQQQSRNKAKKQKKKNAKKAKHANGEKSSKGTVSRKKQSETSSPKSTTKSNSSQSLQSSPNTQSPSTHKRDRAKAEGLRDRDDTRDTRDATHARLDACNGAYGEQSKHTDPSAYPSLGDASLKLLEHQEEMFEPAAGGIEMPDEYFDKTNISSIMQNKLKLEIGSKVAGISIWRDKQELEPLLHPPDGDGHAPRNYHTNSNPNLFHAVDDVAAGDAEEDEEEDDDPFVDNFDDVRDVDGSDHEVDPEGDANGLKHLKRSHCNFSSNSNDSEIDTGDLLDPAEREMIRTEELRERETHEPGSVPDTFPEGINSNPDLIKFQSLQRSPEKDEADAEEERDERPRRNSALLNSSMTSQVDGGFDVDAEDEEKQTRIELQTRKKMSQKAKKVKKAKTKAMPTFNAQGVERAKTQFVPEEETECEDLFADMEVNEPEVTAECEEEEEKPEVTQFGAEGVDRLNALHTILASVAAANKSAESKSTQANEDQDEKERERGDDDKEKTRKKNVAKMFANTKKMVQTETKSVEGKEKGGNTGKGKKGKKDKNKRKAAKKKKERKAKKNHKKAKAKKNSNQKKEDREDREETVEQQQQQQQQEAREAVDDTHSVASVKSLKSVSDKAKSPKPTQSHRASSKAATEKTTASKKESSASPECRSQTSEVSKEEVSTVSVSVPKHKSSTKVPAKKKREKKKRAKKKKQKAKLKLQQLQQQQQAEAEEELLQQALLANTTSLQVLEPSAAPQSNSNSNSKADASEDVDSSSNAPSSVPDVELEAGWITKGTKGTKATKVHTHTKTSKVTKHKQSVVNNKHKKRESKRGKHKSESSALATTPTKSTVASTVSPVSTSSKSSAATSKKSFVYGEAIDAQREQSKSKADHRQSPRDRDRDRDKKRKKRESSAAKDSTSQPSAPHKKPMLKKAKSLSSTSTHSHTPSSSSSANSNSNKALKTKTTPSSQERNRKNRKERRSGAHPMRGVGRHKSDPMLLASHKNSHSHTSHTKATKPAKFASSTIVVPSRHSKTIKPHLILPRNCAPAVSDPLSKHSYPPLKGGVASSPSKGRNRPDIAVNLSVLTPPRASSLTPSSNKSTPMSSANEQPRPTRPPITRLQPKTPAKEHLLTTPPSATRLMASQSAQTCSQTSLFMSADDNSVDRHERAHSKPPLMHHRSAPLIETSTLSTQTDLHDNVEDVMMESKQDVDVMDVHHSPLLVGAPGTTGACPLIASGDANAPAATHMAVYIDEKGEYVETPITLPLAAFPMAPPAVPLPTFLPSQTNVQPNPKSDNSPESSNTTETLSGPSGPTDTAALVTATATTAAPPPPTHGLLPLSFPAGQPPPAFPIPPPGAFLPPGVALPALAGLPALGGFALPGGLVGVPAPLGSIPNTIPILLPMPQFTAEQIANMQKLQIGTATSTPMGVDTETSEAAKSTLKPKMPSFKPSIKSVKLEDIKEEDEHEHMDSEHEFESEMGADDGDEKEEVQMPLLPSECLEALRGDLIGDEREDEWVEIAGLDSSVYPATLWCLHAKSFEAAPECSLEKLQSAMASALLSS